MECFLSAHRREHDWRVPLRSEKVHGHVDVLNVNEAACSNLDPRVAFAICSRCSVIVHTRGEVAKMCWRQYLARRRLKIHHIEGLVRRSNYTVALLQGIEPANNFFQSSGAVGQPSCLVHSPFTILYQ